MDDADLTTERMEREEMARRRSQSRYVGPEAIGECLWCSEPLSDGLRWCNADCRNWWEWSERRANQ